MTGDLCRLGAMTRGVIMSLGLAVDDLEAGHYGIEDRERLASYLDNLALALRGPGGQDPGPVVDGSRVYR
ncbi:hypothetical protein FHU35_15356 [Saccharopolyspora dendranthemae]|uniref:Uncharacterized protein n=2 Tax=Saccharopolyspora dendranthemae TaxID=1181886 RepID=A0A561U2C0_9PSEU|nr:hypothetical protein FHU35_15356 [Saccharopolyspora dendranthemae]